MKTIPAMIAASILVASFGASAQVRTATDTLNTQVAPTKEAAYKMGLDKLTQLKSLSSRQLEFAINTPLGAIEDNSLRLNDGAYITVQEEINSNGERGYVGQVNVALDYAEHDSDN